MVKIDLITGFLGAGKTTFIKAYAKYLIDSGLNIGILENDYGAVNVDMMLLKELAGEHCELEMVSGGCDRDCHRRRFKTKLIAMGMCGYDRVIVEPSGIFDVDEFFDALREEPLDAWYEIGNVIAIVDAELPNTLSDSAEYLLASEAADAGLLVISKTDRPFASKVSDILSHINRALSGIRCTRRFSLDNIISKSWASLDTADWEKILHCGCVYESWQKRNVDDGEAFMSCSFMNLSLSGDALTAAAKQILSDPFCGKIHRIKGFFKNAEGWMELNATPQAISVNPIADGQDIVIVIGEALSREHIASYLPSSIIV